MLKLCFNILFFYLTFLFVKNSFACGKSSSILPAENQNNPSNIDIMPEPRTINPLESNRFRAKLNLGNQQRDLGSMHENPEIFRQNASSEFDLKSPHSDTSYLQRNLARHEESLISSGNKVFGILEHSEESDQYVTKVYKIIHGSEELQCILEPTPYFPYAFVITHDHRIRIELDLVKVNKITKNDHIQRIANEAQPDNFDRSASFKLSSTGGAHTTVGLLKSAIFAGEIQFDEYGRVFFWNNQSGTYQFEDSHAQQAFGFLPGEKFRSFLEK